MRYPGYGAGRRGHLRVFFKKKICTLFRLLWGKKYGLLRSHLIVFGHDASTPKQHANVAYKVKNFSRHDSVHFHTKYFSGVGISEDHETKNHHVPHAIGTSVRVGGDTIAALNGANSTKTIANEHHAHKFHEFRAHELFVADPSVTWNILIQQQFWLEHGWKTKKETNAGVDEIKRIKIAKIRNVGFGWHRRTTGNPTHVRNGTQSKIDEHVEQLHVFVHTDLLAEGVLASDHGSGKNALHQRHTKGKHVGKAGKTHGLCVTNAGDESVGNGSTDKTINTGELHECFAFVRDFNAVTRCHLISPDHHAETKDQAVIRTDLDGHFGINRHCCCR